MNVRLRWVWALLLCAVTVAIVAVNPLAAAEKPAVIIHESVRDAGERDSWSAFTVRVSSAAGFQGELRLVPTPLQQRAQPAAGQRPPPTPDLAAPSIRAPLALEPGVERLVSVMAPVSDAAYRAEVRDASGRLVFAGQARQGLAKAAYNVGLLTDRRSGDALFQVGAQLPLSISRRFRAAVDFPSDALLLEGLEAIVIADFDSATLSPEQRQALLDFVALGGALITTGGASAGRTVGALPEALVPVRPDATAAASLAPLVDLVGETTTAVTSVTTGELRSGQSVVGAPTGPPLVVEAALGLGLVVQLTYDPYAVLAEQPNAAGALRSLPWSVGLLRAAGAASAPPNVQGGQGGQGDPTASRPAPEWAVLDQAPGPKTGKGGPAGLLLLVYPLIVGAVAFVLSKERGKPPWRWAAVPALTVFVTMAVLAVDWGLRARPLTGDEVTVERLGSTASPARVESFHRLVPAARGDVVLRLGGGTLATTAAAPRPPPVLPALPPERRRPPGAGRDVVDLNGGTLNGGTLNGGTLNGGTRVDLTGLLSWDARRLHTLSLSGQGGWLEAHLRLQAGRVVGTVSNRGDRPVRRMRVQAADGTRAELGAEVAPGATAQVDAPFGPGQPPGADIEASVLDAAAMQGSDDRNPGELALVGLVPDRPALAAQKSYRANTSHRAVFTTIDLEAADGFVLDYGAPKAVCCGTTGRGPGVYELRLPPGMAGPFALEQTTPSQTTPSQAAIYDWTSGLWRPLPMERQSKSPITPAEIKDGMVRIRASIETSSAGLRAVAGA